MDDDLEAVLATVRERVEPSPAEREALEGAVETLLDRTRAALADRAVDGEVVHVGSTVRDTWLAGDRDIDIFVRFPPDLDRDDLQTHGLAIGHAVLPDGREEYAEHPYVTGEFDGFGVDVVPCYAVESASEIRSAVDRTPFHTEYLKDRLTTDLTVDVRLCKQFCTGIGIYGSDLRTQGLSGFLVELLVCEYGGFEALLTAAADWQPPVRFDPEGHGTATFNDALVFIDPTDPERNVAAVLTDENVARFQHFARSLLAEPRAALFESPEYDRLTPSEVRTAFEERGTTPVALRFDTPDIVDDQLWPQLRRSHEGIGGALDRLGFDVLRSATFCADEGDDTLLLFELERPSLPAVERHEGPPVHVREHAESFYEQYESTDVAGPFIDGQRYVVERPREWQSATAYLQSDALFDVALGAAVEATLQDDYDVLAGEDVATFVDALGADFACYLSPTPRNS